MLLDRVEPLTQSFDPVGGSGHDRVLPAGRVPSPQHHDDDEGRESSHDGSESLVELQQTNGVAPVDLLSLSFVMGRRSITLIVSRMY